MICALMYGLLLFIAGLVAIPFLFPEETVRWLRKALHWLEERRETRERETQRFDRLDQDLMDWESWVDTLRQKLPHTNNAAQRYHLLAQALAAGQRYLQGTDRQDSPEAYQISERLCQHLERQLDSIKQRAREKGRSLTASPPIASACLTAANAPSHQPAA